MFSVQYQIFYLLFLRSRKLAVANWSTSSSMSDCRLRLRKSDDDVIISRDHARDVLDRMATRFAAQQVLSRIYGLQSNICLR